MVVLLVAQLLPESHRCTLYWEQQHPLLGKDRICHLFVFVVYISYVMTCEALLGSVLILFMMND